MSVEGLGEGATGPGSTGFQPMGPPLFTTSNFLEQSLMNLRLFPNQENLVGRASAPARTLAARDGRPTRRPLGRAVHADGGGRGPPYKNFS